MYFWHDLASEIVQQRNGRKRTKTLVSCRDITANSDNKIKANGWVKGRVTAVTQNKEKQKNKPKVVTLLYQKNVSWLYRMTLAKNSQKRLATKMTTEPAQPRSIDLQRN